MKMQDALEIINKKPATGYRVHFERIEGKFLRTDYFPDRGEDLIATEEEAWQLAHKFAEKTLGECVNLYVVDAGFSPVPGYSDKKIKNR